MKKKNGYTIPDLLIVAAIVGFIALVTIIKVSYAFSEISNPEQEERETNHLVECASVTYAKHNKDEFTKEKETFIYAKEVAAAGFLFEKEEYNSMKVKITYDEANDSFSAEVVK